MARFKTETSPKASRIEENSEEQDQVSRRLEQKDFCLDEGGVKTWDFLSIMRAGQNYLDLPIPRHLTIDGRYDDGPLEALLSPERKEEIRNKRDSAAQLLGYMTPERIAIMANTDVGIGTEPEHVEQGMLNIKRRILKRSTFATCLTNAGLYETVQAVHTITEDSRQKNGRNLDFGFAAGFEGVQLGFEAAYENTSDSQVGENIIAIADLRYKWATTESRIHSDKLHKYLTDDCMKALDKLKVPQPQDEYGGESHPKELKDLAKSISHFIERHGTHVVLKCTHGYRLEKEERTKVKSVDEVRKLKAGMMASLLGYLGLRTEYQQDLLKSSESTENYLGIKNIGSKEHMKKALEGNVSYKDMMQHASLEVGDAGVISHDWNMMIADVLASEDEGNSYREIVSDRLRYWTYARINDLKGGWNEGLFSVAFQLKFKQPKNPSKEDVVCVTVGGRTTVHERPNTARELVGHVTNVHRDEVDLVRVSALYGLKLKDTLAKITVFRRFLRPDGKQGFVLATEIPTEDVAEDELSRELFDMETWNDWKKLVKDEKKSVSVPKELEDNKELMKVVEELKNDEELRELLDNTREMSIGEARAKVCMCRGCETA